MSEESYLVRSPLLDPQQRVLGYKLRWQKNEHLAAVAGPAGLAGLVSGTYGEAWPGTIFLQCNPLVLDESARQAVAPRTQSMVWVLDPDALTAADYPALAVLREEGFGLALRGVDPDFVQANEALLCLMTHVEVHGDVLRLAEISRHLKQHQPTVSVLAGHSADWAGFEACAALDIPVFFEALCSSPRAMNSAGVLTSQAALILQLMQMVQENADVQHLEKLLKSDAVLSYKLFRYINSASFGLKVEIESLRHAVAMLGYKPLFRWLHFCWP